MVQNPVKDVHSPQRTCIGCRQQDDQIALHRFHLRDGSATDSPSVALDAIRAAGGRGAWLHLNTACLNRALKTRAFNRAFRTHVDTQNVEAEFQQAFKAIENVQDRDESGSKI